MIHDKIKAKAQAVIAKVKAVIAPKAGVQYGPSKKILTPVAPVAPVKPVIAPAKAPAPVLKPTLTPTSAFMGKKIAPVNLRQGTGSFIAPNATVRTVQQQLGATQDGVFGPQTNSAVMKFQEDKGLKVDGVVGPLTAGALLTAQEAEAKEQTVKAPGVVTKNPGDLATEQVDPNNRQAQIAQMNEDARIAQEESATSFTKTLGTKVDVSDSSKLTKAITDVATAPRPVRTSLVDTLSQKRAELKVGDKEGELATADSDLAKLDAEFAALSDEESGRQVSVLQIGRRQTEQQKLYGKAKSELALKRSRIVNELNQKYNVIDSIMKYTAADYENATQEYNTNFNQAIAFTNMLKGIEEDRKSDIEKATDNARANITVISNLLRSGNIEWDSLDSATKLKYRQMEAQAGMPEGTLEFISKTIKDPAISTTVDKANNRVIVTTKDQSTGIVKTSIIALPKVGDENQISSTGVTALKNALQASKFTGAEADGKYADPNLYLQNYNSYPDKAEFLRLFPPATYINPANTFLPQEIMRFTKKTEQTFTNPFL